MPDPIALLRQYWNHGSFLPPQEEIILSVLAGKDTIALLPTGGGKSICFQVPAMANPGLCLVISPLVALMKDQSDSLRKRGITAFTLHSGMTRKELVQILQTAGASNCKFLFVSPERLETDLFLEYVRSLSINLIAVDEAHCVSQWGYDFRPPYLRIAAFRKELPQIPMLALTASATPEVLEDIGDKLGLHQPVIFRRSFSRPQLSYSLFKVSNKIQKVTEILQRVAGSGIVYCKTRRSATEVSEALIRQGISAAAYHAGLPSQERSQRQDDWKKEQLRIIVSTNAFGMGIDKPNVRTVIHTDAPDSVEHYYQEAGRAGRDGQKAYAVLLTDEKDAEKLAGLPDVRFPPIDEIRPVYQHLMNYLQLPAGMGEGKYYDFDLSGFTGRFGLSMPIALAAIRSLEQAGLCSFLQQAYLPAKGRFTTGKETLYDFEKNHPGLVSILDALLRTYEGIFDHPVSIRDRQLAYITRKSTTEIAAELSQLQAFGLFEYMPAKETPQLYFLRDRPNAEDLYIDPIAYRKRKEQYATRIRTMIRYTGLTEKCRSRFLANYFGDQDAVDCGICDNCLNNARHT